jgi:hypothetical protein
MPTPSFQVILSAGQVATMREVATPEERRLIWRMIVSGQIVVTDPTAGALAGLLGPWT